MAGYILPRAADDYSEFFEWFRKHYGSWRANWVTKSSYINMPEYQQWVLGGRLEGPLTTTIPTTGETAPPTTPEEKPPTDEEEEYTYSVEAVGDWNYLFKYDSKGKRTMADPTPLGEAGPSREALAYQEAASRERAGQMWQGLMPDRRREDLAAEFEEMKRQMIAAITPSQRNWIALWAAENQQNPYTQALSPDEELEALQSEADLIASSAKNIRGRMKDPNDPLTQGAIGSPQNTEQQMAQAVLNAETVIGEKLSEMKLARAAGISQVLGTGLDVPQEILSKYPEQVEAGVWSQPRAEGGGFAVGKPEEPSEAVSDMPEIPDWLASLSGVKGNVPKKRTAITTPSAQQWTALTPTKQQMYAGLVDWAGERTYEDILTGMQQQLPTPGTATKQWKATTQRV